MKEATGKVWLVGAGPGDPALITLAGKAAIQKGDVIVYDALANPDLLDFAKDNAQLVYVGKIADNHALPQDEINALLAQHALQGNNVVRLKGGDPYIFGRGGEEAEYLASQKIPFEVIPGISSAIAAPAYAGIPLTHRDLVSSVTIITGHENPRKKASAHDWKAFAKSGSTLVFLMGMRNLQGICDNLIQNGMPQETPAAVIYRGATAQQKVATAPLGEIAKKASDAGLSNPAVIVIGKVVNLREKLDWLGQRPLSGKTVVVTRAREQASELATSLTELGAIVIQCPTIKIEHLRDYHIADEAIQRLDKYEWLIFTSVNGVKCFWERLAHANRDSRALGKSKVAAIGPATALALENRGVRPDLMPESYDGESVANALIEYEGDKLHGKHILVPRALVARSALPDMLNEAGALVKIAPVYETTEDKAHLTEVRELIRRNKLNCITFGSSSTVENFLKLVPAQEIMEHPEIALAAIGPVTANCLIQHGLTPTIQPESYTIPALLGAIVSYYEG